MKIQTAIKPNFPKGAMNALKRAELLLPPKQHGSGTKPTIVIDGMNLAYIAYYAYSKLSHKGKSTSILFGFPSIVKSILQLYPAQKVIVCWDGCKHEKRLETLPVYKSHREKDRDPKGRKLFLKEISKLRQLLHRMGITQAHNPNIEGDDMVYWIWKRMKMYGKVLIASGDKDFKQLIDWDTQVYNPRSKFVEGVFAFSSGNYGIEVSQYIDFLILVGDKSDDIPGYPGIGPARAASFLNKFWSIKNYLDDKKAEFPGMMDKQKVKRIYKQNRVMINLQYFNEKYNNKVNIIYYRDTSSPTFNEKKYKAICNRYGLKTMLYSTFMDPFKKLGDE